MARDFNGTVDNKWDRRGGGSNIYEGKLPKVFFDLIKQETIEDTWRKLNPTVIVFTFYSARHQYFPRIDMDY